MRRPHWALVLVLAAAGAACGARTSPRTPPTAGARAWVAAVRRDEPRAAYRLLSNAARDRVSYDDFARRWREMPVERRRQADLLAAILREGAAHGERARLVLPGGKTVPLVRETDGWRLDTPLLATARAATPQEALRVFAAAIEARSFDGVMRVLTSARREGLRQVLDSFATGLRAHLTDAMEVSGDRATLIWSDGRRRWKVSLRREDGEWRVDDFNPL